LPEKRSGAQPHAFAALQSRTKFARLFHSCHPGLPRNLLDVSARLSQKSLVVCAALIWMDLFLGSCHIADEL
jgi:hypothetical protein